MPRILALQTLKPENVVGFVDADDSTSSGNGCTCSTSSFGCPIKPNETVI